MSKDSNRIIAAITLAITFVTILQGCATGAQDTSAGGPTAVVKGFGGVSPFRSKCSLFAEPRYDDLVKWGSARLSTRELTIDAGRATVIAQCTFADFIAWSGLSILEFEAAAGHIYSVRRGGQEPECLELVDVSDGKKVIACKPFRFGSYLNLSTGVPSAFLLGGIRNSQDYASCRFSVAEHEAAALVRIDPGEIKMNVRCSLEGFFIGDFDGLSEFRFAAVAGHKYAISQTDDKELCLMDITTSPSQIDCQNYKRKFSPSF